MVGFYKVRSALINMLMYSDPLIFLKLFHRDLI